MAAIEVLGVALLLAACNLAVMGCFGRINAWARRARESALQKKIEEMEMLITPHC
jgi:hypothetical protein